MCLGWGPTDPGLTKNIKKDGENNNEKENTEIDVTFPDGLHKTISYHITG